MTRRAMTEAAKEAKANAIMDKAAEMFLESDYEKVRMADIAKAMGISNGILFVYFKSKETLFLKLLVREYDKRFSRMFELMENNDVSTYDNFKKMILHELEEIADENSLYIRLEVMRSMILEKNIDHDLMVSIKLKLIGKMTELANFLGERCPLSAEEMFDVINAELAIISGCKLTATLPQSCLKILDEYQLEAFKLDFKKEVLKTMERYLDGLWLGKNKK